MKLFLIAALTALAAAKPKPDVSHILPQIPSTNYGAPILSGQGFQSTTPSPISFGSTTPASDFQLPIHEAVAFQQQNFGLNPVVSNVGNLGIGAPSVDANLNVQQYNGGFQEGLVGFQGYQNFGFGGDVVSTTAAPEFGNVQYITSTVSPLAGYDVGSVSTTVSPFANFGSNFDTFNFGSSLGYSPLVNSYGNSIISNGKVRFGNEENTVVKVTAGNELPQVQTKEAEVTKNVYFFSAPEEPEEPQVRKQVELPPPKKTHNIIIVKAPTFKTNSKITVPVPPQNQEKTHVYVLVKQPETQQEVELQTQAPVPPPKPEVFFIKYKTVKEAEEAIANAKNGVAGVNVNINEAALNMGGFVPALEGATIYSGDSENSNAGGFDGGFNLGGAIYNTFAPGALRVEVTSTTAAPPSYTSNVANVEQRNDEEQVEVTPKTTYTSTTDDNNASSAAAAAEEEEADDGDDDDSSNESSSSSVNSDIFISKSSNSVVPHETYGLPKDADV